MTEKTARFRQLMKEPQNRPAISLLGKASLAMVTLPLGTYFLCYKVLLAEGGIYDLSEDLNTRVNISGFASIFVVQLVIVGHVIAAFRQDAAEFEKEKQG